MVGLTSFANSIACNIMLLSFLMVSKDALTYAKRKGKNLVCKNLKMPKIGEKNEMFWAHKGNKLRISVDGNQNNDIFVIDVE